MPYTLSMFERCLYFNTNALVRKVNQIWKQAFQEVGLSPSHAYLLRLVIAEPGLPQRRIAEELNLEKSTVTRFIDKMEAGGYLTRQILAGRSTREQNIFPTEKALHLSDKLEAIGDALYAQLSTTVGEGTLKQLVVDLREANETL